MAQDLPDLELRKEWTRLRALLYETHEVSLSTDDRDGHRWLTDRYVLLDITGSVAAEGVDDGIYKLVQSKGFEARAGALRNFLGGGIVDYLEKVESGALWAPVIHSQWSVAEHPGKAMLLVAETPWPNTPCLMGESTWTTLHRHYPECRVEYDVCSNRNLFRVSEPYYKSYTVRAYVAGIRVPTGQGNIASAIAALTQESTSN